MCLYPFKDHEVADRFADGLLKAGLPGQPSGYYKILEENRLTGEEIRELLFGRTVTWFSSSTRTQWWIKSSEDGKKVKIWGLFSDSGKSWVEDDLICRQWENILGGLKYCHHIYRNPEGTSEEKNEYLRVADFGISPRSPVD